MALVTQHPAAKIGTRAVLIALGLFGAALLYGDGMITPAISVLGAVEGLKVATHVFEPFIVPVTIAILLALFMIQSRGTKTVGAMFGPVMISLVREHRPAGSPVDRASTARPGGAQSDRRRQVSVAERLAWLRRAGLGLPRGDGRRSAVCRHGTLRPASDSTRLVCVGAAGPGAQLSRPGRDALDQSRSRGAAVLSDGAVVAPVPARRARDHGRRHRLAGPDLRRVLR
jgi:hypothetical protein